MHFLKSNAIILYQESRKFRNILYGELLISFLVTTLSHILLSFPLNLITKTAKDFDFSFSEKESIWNLG